MLGLVANDHDDAPPLDDLALLAARLDGRSDFHVLPRVFPIMPGSCPAGDPAPSVVVTGQLDSNASARPDAHRAQTGACRQVRQHVSPIDQLNLEEIVGQ